MTITISGGITTGNISINGSGYVTNGLIVYIDSGVATSYPSTGTTWSDLSGTGNNYTLIASPTFTATNPSKFTLAAASSQYMQSPDFTTALASSFSFEVWCRPTASGVVICEQGTTVINSTWFDSYMEVVTNTLRVGFWNGTTTNNLNCGAVTLNNWYQFTMTWNGTTLTGYINGVFAASGTYTRATNNPIYYMLGAACPTSLGSGAYFSGDMAIFRAYNTSLSANQVLQNYNFNRATFGL